jgi:hypothetical protein
MLVIQEGRLAIEKDCGLWNTDILETSRHGPRQLFLGGISVAREQRRALSPNNATVVSRQPKRCAETTVFRRAKDSSKERLKTYKEKHLPDRDNAPRQTNRPANNTKRQHLAGAARPIPRKYDGLSQN